MKKLKTLYSILYGIKLIPHIIIFKTHPRRHLMRQDVLMRINRTGSNTNVTGNTLLSFLQLMAMVPEYRTVFYYRAGPIKYLINFLCPQLKCTVTSAQGIGGGFCIHHGYALTINAEKIGTNFVVYHNVTIGQYKSKRPVIGNNVHVATGATIIGDITIGDNVRIGPNAIIMYNVPPNTTIAAPLSHVVKLNGQKVDLMLEKNLAMKQAQAANS